MVETRWSKYDWLSAKSLTLPFEDKWSIVLSINWKWRKCLWICGQFKLSYITINANLQTFPRCNKKRKKKKKPDILKLVNLYKRKLKIKSTFWPALHCSPSVGYVTTVKTMQPTSVPTSITRCSFLCAWGPLQKQHLLHSRFQHVGRAVLNRSEALRKNFTPLSLHSRANRKKNKCHRSRGKGMSFVVWLPLTGLVNCPKVKSTSWI